VDVLDSARRQTLSLAPACERMPRLHPRRAPAGGPRSSRVPQSQNSRSVSVVTVAGPGKGVTGARRSQFRSISDQLAAEQARRIGVRRQPHHLAPQRDAARAVHAEKSPSPGRAAGRSIRLTATPGRTGPRSRAGPRPRHGTARSWRRRRAGCCPSGHGRRTGHDGRRGGASETAGDFSSVLARTANWPKL
jgi:hypothetical protein